MPSPPFFGFAAWMLVAALVAQPLILPRPVLLPGAAAPVRDGGTGDFARSGARILGGLALAAACGGVLAGISSRSRAFAHCGSGTVVCKGDAGRPRGGPAAHLSGVGAREHRGGLFDGAAGRVFSLAEGWHKWINRWSRCSVCMACAAGACFASIPREVLPFVLSCARAVIGMSWKAGGSRADRHGGGHRG